MMLRISAGVAWAECSCMARPGRVAMQRYSRLQGTETALMTGPRHRLAPPRLVNCVSKTFATSSIKGKEKEIVSGEEEEDPVVVLLAACMKKRDILRRRTDSTTNVEVAKEISDLDELSKLWEEWKTINKVRMMYLGRDAAC